MARKDLRWRMPMLLLLSGILSSVPAFAGSAVIGSVSGSTNATLSGTTLVPNTTIFSGDSLQVRDGVAVVAVGRSSWMVFGRETEASFLRDTREVTVLLSHGNVSLSHPDDNVALRVKVGEITVAPASGFKTVGDVAMLNGAVVVTAKEGSLRVEGEGREVEVAKGKTLTVLPKVRRSPATGGVAHAAASSWWSVGSFASGVLASVLAGVAISRANDARDAGAAATQTAQTADADAVKATAAANAATSAATLATSTALAAGCGLNLIAIRLSFPSSPFAPPTGLKCP